MAQITHNAEDYAPIVTAEVNTNTDRNARSVPSEGHLVRRARVDPGGHYIADTSIRSYRATINESVSRFVGTTHTADSVSKEMDNFTDEAGNPLDYMDKLEHFMRESEYDLQKSQFFLLGVSSNTAIYREIGHLDSQVETVKNSGLSNLKLSFMAGVRNIYSEMDKRKEGVVAETEAALKENPAMLKPFIKMGNV